MGLVIRAHTQALVFVKKNIWYTGTFFFTQTSACVLTLQFGSS